jgi:hypothetical protein
LILLVVLAGGCAGQTDEPTAAAPGTTTTTVAPTTTTLPPLTAKELAWLKAIPTVGRKIEKSIEAISNLTPSAMVAGWSERCGGQRSLLWARDQVARWRPLVEETQVTLAPPEPARSRT